MLTLHETTFSDLAVPQKTTVLQCSSLKIARWASARLTIINAIARNRLNEEHTSKYLLSQVSAALRLPRSTA